LSEIEQRRASGGAGADGTETGLKASHASH
jgi:hypothetical protein